MYLIQPSPHQEKVLREIMLYLHFVKTNISIISGLFLKIILFGKFLNLVSTQSGSSLTKI